MNKILIIHPTGNANVKNLVVSLRDAGLECCISTGFVYSKRMDRFLNFIPNPLRNKIKEELLRRNWFDIERVCVRSHFSLDLMKQLLLRLRFFDVIGLQRNAFNNEIFRDLDLITSRQLLSRWGEGFNGIYAYEDGAAVSFEHGKKIGALCLYELPVCFYKKTSQVMAQEVDQWPQLKGCGIIVDEPQWKIDRKEKEVALAHHIFVPSQFSKDSLTENGCPPSKITVMPYGAPVDDFYPVPKKDGKFRVLFVGRVGPRKGVHYLLKAWTQLKLKEAELLLVGTDWFPRGWLGRYIGDTIKYSPSVPYRSLHGFYCSADVFVFPSLAEGFGLVLLEAMACGIPVIATPHTAGPDIVDEGRDGFIVPIRDVEALKAKILWCYDHPRELAEMKGAARKKALQLSWNQYRSRIASEVTRLMRG